MTERQCPHCKVVKTIGDFYPKSPRCKKCHKAQVMALRATKTAEYLNKQSAYKAANKARLLAQAKEYRDRPESKESQRVHNLNRRSRQKNAPGKFTAADVRALMKKQNGCCSHCGRNIRSKYHIDHIIALVRGGSNWPSNLQLLCPTCNMVKGDRLPIPLPALPRCQ